MIVVFYFKEKRIGIARSVQYVTNALPVNDTCERYPMSILQSVVVGKVYGKEPVGEFLQYLIWPCGSQLIVG